jgi:hypothetical protein
MIMIAAQFCTTFAMKDQHNTPAILFFIVIITFDLSSYLKNIIYFVMIYFTTK